MPPQQNTSGAQMFRKRLREIKLHPNTSSYDIGIEIHVDGKRVHKLPILKKGQALKWTDLCLPCDVYEGSAIVIQVTEVHIIRDRVGQATYQVSQATDQDVASLACNALNRNIQIIFLNDEETERAYSAAFVKSQQVEKRPGMVQRAGKVGNAFKTLLALGEAMAELDPTGGAKVAFSLCTKAWECLEQQEKQDAKLDELVENIAGMIPSVESIKGVADEDLSRTVIAMLNLIEDVSVFILGFRSLGSIERAMRAMISSESEEQIDAYTARFRGLREQFDTRVNVQALRADELERMNARLRPVSQARYNPDQQCITGTRLGITNEISTWAQQPNADARLAWVHGPAGFGKSSIATSVCMSLDDGPLGASFFCKRDNPELRDPRRVLTTIAYQLAIRWKPYRNAVMAAIREDPELHTHHFQALYDALLGSPLRMLSKQDRGTLVLVVDALDECGDPTTRKPLLRCLQDLSQLTHFLRVVITSRPDRDIQEFFAHEKTCRFVEFNVLEYDASDDIRVFVRNRLGHMVDTQDLPADAADQVAHRASGLFIWARTACAFITEGIDKRKYLDLVLFGTKLADIDSLYTMAIGASLPDAEGDNKACMLELLGAVVATATRTPLSVANLALLLRGRSPRVLEGVLSRLLSVLYVDHNRDDAVRVFHPSFMDYLTDRNRSKGWYVDLDEHNTTLAKCCLETMTDYLTFNICGLETSDLFNSDVRDLDVRIGTAIRPHMSYSCLYWSSHVTNAQIDSLDRHLRRFLFGRELLYWIEALSLLGKLNATPASLLELMNCHLPNDMEDCRETANDVYRFVLSFYDAISASTPHLYVSALAFAPCNSGIIQRMRSHFPNLLTIAEGTEKEWTPCLRTISVSSGTRSTAYSPDSRRIVSGSRDGTVRIWDAETGDTVLDPLIGHSGEVLSVAFSPDGHWIVSGSEDETIRLWDAEAGRARGGPLRGHKGSVLSVAFSPNGRHIASGSLDDTARTWDTETGQSTLVLSGHSDVVWSVAFSPDGRRLVSGSGDHTLRIWDAETGASVLKPLLGHSDGVFAVAFSPDGHHIVSGSEDNSVRIWDAKTGQPLLDPLQGHSNYVNSVAFSANSRLIVSGSGDSTVRIWDAQTGAAVGPPLDGHSGGVQSVAFSSDGSRVVSGSYDKTVRIWDIVGGGISGRTQESTQHNGHSGYMNSVAFSPNGQRIASGSDDKTVRIWDAETGALVLGPLEGNTNSVRAVAFSSDSRRIASGSDDCTVRIWNSEIGKPALDPSQGHSDSVMSIAFSPDWRLIASGSRDKTIRIWDAETGRAVLQPLTGHSDWVTSVAFSAVSRRIVSGSRDNTVRTWDAEIGQAVLGPLTGHSDRVTSVAFSPDGHRIVSGSDDKTVRIWDAETGNPVYGSLEGHGGWVQSVAFSPDGCWILSGSNDCTVRFWDAETGNPVLEPLRGHSSWVRSVAFSPDGRRIVSGSDDMTVRIWDVELHTGSTDKTPRLLHGTHVPTISQDIAGDRVLVNSAQLARHMHPEQAGWVTSTEGKPIVWLPPELRNIDDSILCISPTRIRRPIVVDFTNFVHGTSWTSIVDALD
ncbi:hypothetical protein FRC09_001564 [Ceratobasidium sp. 395]|nr:hypothetical protein FRC09_001564 [Ceratobasidium sp. 395]